MLLRTTALALLLANCAYFAWSQGLLAPLGLAPDSGREPQRLVQQIRPESLRVAPAALQPTEAALPTPSPLASTPASASDSASASASSSAAARPAGEVAAPVEGSVAQATPPAAVPSCLQAGPFDSAQSDALRQALAAAGVPAAAWSLEPIAPAERWIVYMGRYADVEALDRKRAELRALRVDTAPITQPALAPGLSLGVFSSQASAQEHLAQLVRRGVRTARVVAEPREPTSARLLLPAADTALRTQVQGLGPALAGRTLAPC